MIQAPPAKIDGNWWLNNLGDGRRRTVSLLCKAAKRLRCYRRILARARSARSFRTALRPLPTVHRTTGNAVGGDPRLTAVLFTAMSPMGRAEKICCRIIPGENPYRSNSDSPDA